MTQDDMRDIDENVTMPERENPGVLQTMYDFFFQDKELEGKKRAFCQDQFLKF